MKKAISIILSLMTFAVICMNPQSIYAAEISDDVVEEYIEDVNFDDSENIVIEKVFQNDQNNMR